jgi:hypothetical protein
MGVRRTSVRQIAAECIIEAAGDEEGGAAAGTRMLDASRREIIAAIHAAFRSAHSPEVKLPRKAARRLK